MDSDVGVTRAAVRRIAAWGLTAGGREPLAIPAGRWPETLAEINAQSLTGLALAAAERGDAAFTEGQVSDLLANQRQIMLHALSLERALLPVAAALTEAGIGFAVLKGPVMAHTVYRSPEMRPFNDIDLLVRGNEFDRAGRILEACGLRRVRPEPRPGFDARFGKAAVHRTLDGLEFDLHHTLALGAFGLWIRSEELFGRTVDFSLGGTRLLGLDRTALLVHATVHASLGWNPPLLLPLRDVAELSVAGGVDWDAAVDLARRWRLGAVMAHAFQAVRDVLGTAVPREAEAVTALPSGFRERRALRAFTTERRDQGGTALSTIAAIPTMTGRAAYLRALLLPGREFLSARAGPGSRPSYLRRWAVPVRWLASRPRTSGGGRG